MSGPPWEAGGLPPPPIMSAQRVCRPTRPHPLRTIPQPRLHAHPRGGGALQAQSPAGGTHPGLGEGAAPPPPPPPAWVLTAAEAPTWTLGRGGAGMSEQRAGPCLLPSHPQVPAGHHLGQPPPRSLAHPLITPPHTLLCILLLSGCIARLPSEAGRSRADSHGRSGQKSGRFLSLWS